MIIAVDPGGTTGMALWDDDELIRTWGEPDQMQVIDFVAATPAIDTVVCESFTITSATAKKSRGGSNTAIEIIGALRYICWRNEYEGMKFVTQAPVDARMFSTDDKIAKMGWKPRRTPDHELSACRHLLLYLVKTGEVDPSCFL